jgi:hypothetical protein
VWAQTLIFPRAWSTTAQWNIKSLNRQSTCEVSWPHSLTYSTSDSYRFIKQLEMVCTFAHTVVWSCTFLDKTGQLAGSTAATAVQSTCGRVCTYFGNLATLLTYHCRTPIHYAPLAIIDDSKVWPIWVFVRSSCTIASELEGNSKSNVNEFAWDILLNEQINAM